MHPVVQNKASRLYLFLGTFFVANALIAECIGVKIFSLEKTLGISQFHFNFFGIKDLSFQMTAGVLLWPLEFVMTDIINEYFGPKGVRRISVVAVSLIGYAFIMFYSAMRLAPADFWIGVNANNGVPDMQHAYSAIFGQGMWIIVGSLSAFMISQLVDVFVFHWVKKKTGDKMMWLRSTGSTVVSQFIDSFIVLFIAFYIGQGWDFRLVMAICLINYIYKFIMAVVLTPVLYIVHIFIERFLGKNLADEMKQAAMSK